MVNGLLPLQHDGLLLGRLQDAHSDVAFSFLNSSNLQPGDRVSEGVPALEEGKSLSSCLPCSALIRIMGRGSESELWHWLRRPWHLLAGQDRFSTEGHLQASSPMLRFLYFLDKVAIPPLFHCSHGEEQVLGTHHSVRAAGLICTGCTSDTLTCLPQLRWHKILAAISHVDCCWPYLQDQDHVFLLIPGRTSFKRPRIGNSSVLFPCFPHIFSSGGLFTTVTQVEKEGWCESVALAAGHSVDPTTLHTLPGPSIPCVAMLHCTGDAQVSRGRKKHPASLFRRASPLGLESTSSASRSCHEDAEAQPSAHLGTAGQDAMLSRLTGLCGAGFS